MTGPIRWRQKTNAALRRRRTVLLRQLPSLKELLRGSLIERYKKCGKPGCKCVQGAGHGPKIYLSVSRPGTRPQMEYVPQAYQDEVTEFVTNYRKAREILDELAEINLELLRRREKLR